MGENGIWVPKMAILGEFPGNLGFILPPWGSEGPRGWEIRDFGASIWGKIPGNQENPWNEGKSPKTGANLEGFGKIPERPHGGPGLINGGHQGGVNWIN